MAEPEAPADGELTAYSSGTLLGREIPAAPSRRRLLQTLTIGGSLLLAGCGQSDSTTSTGTSGASGQTFRAPTKKDAAKTSFYRGGTSLQNTAYAGVVKEPASFNLRRFLRESGVWVSGRLVPGPNTQIQYNWIEKPIKITPTKVTFKIRDDAKWSDGHPITGKDLAFIPIALTLQQYFSPPAYAPETTKEPERVRFAFDDFEIGKKSVTYRSSEGHFERFWDLNIAFNLGTVFYPTFSPTHIEPFDAYADAVIETARRAKAGEIYPWYKHGYGDPHRESLIQEHLADRKYVEKFSKPKHVLATGPWDLVDMSGTEFLFKKNLHHRHADALNFEQFIFEYTPSAERQQAALKADRLDYATARAGSPTPQAVVESLPNHFKHIRVPNSSFGNELRMNFDHPALGRRAIRMAIMYVLDHETIAKNIHPSVTEPVTTPGGDSWEATDYVSQAWIDKNLTTYTKNRDRARKIMRETGFSKESGQWIGADGEPMTLRLPTPSDTPRWEPTVARQLSGFGIDTTVQTLDPSVFRDRVEKGEFAIWPASSAWLTTHAPNTLWLWYHGATKGYYEIYPDKQYKTGDFSDSGTPLPRTEDRWSTFTIQTPPVGQQNGPLQTFHPAAFGLSFYTNPPPEEFRRRVKVSLWLANWFLPTIPLNKQYEQHFIDDAHWQWPTDTPSWQSFIKGDVRPPGEILRNSQLLAKHVNPK